MSENWEITHNSGGQMATVQFVSTSKEIIIAMKNLSKRALRAGAKVIRKKLKSSGAFTANMANHIAASVDVDRKTGQPGCKIGFYGWQKVRKNGKQPSKRNPWWQETGIKPHQITAKDGKKLGANGHFFGHSVQHPGQTGQHNLRNVTYDNIAEIRKAQEEHLAALNEKLDEALFKEDFDEEVDND